MFLTFNYYLFSHKPESREPQESPIWGERDGREDWRVTVGAQRGVGAMLMVGNGRMASFRINN